MFLSTYENKIDKKGRVSVPANFRSHLNSVGYNGFITYPSFNHPALEACSQDRIEKLSNTIDSLNPFEEKRDFFATSILSESEILQFDTEGRVSLSNKLLKHANIKNSILFVGLGFPKQELLLLELNECYSPFVGYTCGAFISQTSQKKIYYPYLINQLNLRWLYRGLTCQHVRKRLIIDYPKFIFKFLTDSKFRYFILNTF